MVAATFLIGRLRARVWGDGSQQASTDARKAQWASGVPKIFSHPLGHGFGRAGEVLGFANQAGAQSIDSYYLNLLLDTGPLGFVSYLAIFIGAMCLAAKIVVTAPPSRELRLLMPLGVTLGAFIVVKGVLSQEANHPLVYMMLGAIVALVHRAKNEARLASTF